MKESLIARKTPPEIEMGKNVDPVWIKGGASKKKSIADARTPNLAKVVH